MSSVLKRRVYEQSSLTKYNREKFVKSANDFCQIKGQMIYTINLKIFERPHIQRENILLDLQFILYKFKGYNGINNHFFIYRCIGNVGKIYSLNGSSIIQFSMFPVLGLHPNILA